MALTAPAALPIPDSMRATPRTDGCLQGLGDLQALPPLRSAWSHVQKDKNVAADNHRYLPHCTFFFRNLLAGKAETPTRYADVDMRLVRRRP